ncbi:MAG TPA: rod shape-determining protein MreD [Bacillota bacterium]|nr:rod shape-determining protein MreD [Bacillota bacterium]
MSGWAIALMLLVNFIMQSTVFRYIAIMGIMPDSALVMVVAVSILIGNRRGAVVGAAAGIMQDIVYGKPVGITTLSYMLTGYIVGEYSGKVFKERLVVPVFFTAGATLLKYFIVIFFNYVLGVPTGIPVYIRHYIPVELIYNCAVSALLYRALYLAFNRDSTQPRVRAKKRR